MQKRLISETIDTNPWANRILRCEKIYSLALQCNWHEQRFWKRCQNHHKLSSSDEMQRWRQNHRRQYERHISLPTTENGHLFPYAETICHLNCHHSDRIKLVLFKYRQWKRKSMPTVTKLSENCSPILFLTIAAHAHFNTQFASEFGSTSFRSSENSQLFRMKPNGSILLRIDK